MVHLLDLIFQGGHVPGGHILQDQEGEGPLAELLQQLVLTDNRLHIRREVIQHIVVDPSTRHAQRGGDHQQQCDYQNRYAAFHDRFGKTHEFNNFLSLQSVEERRHAGLCGYGTRRLIRTPVPQSTPFQ